MMAIPYTSRQVTSCRGLDGVADVGVDAARAGDGVAQAEGLESHEARQASCTTGTRPARAAPASAS